MKTATYRRIITAVEGWYRGESVGVKQSDAPIERKSEDDGFVRQDDASETDQTTVEHGAVTLFDVILQLSKDENVPFEIVRAVYSQKMKSILKVMHTRSKSTYDFFFYYMKYREVNRSMLELANDMRVTPLLVAERVFEHVFDDMHPTVTDLWKKGHPKKRSMIKAFMHEFCSTASDHASFPIRKQFASKIGVGTSLGPTFHADVVECLHHDGTYGPFVDRIKHTIGLEYEYLLQEKLRQLNIGFLSEDIQRTNRHVRTPDCVLLTPVEICGHLCHWIESKASFGDEQSMSQSEKEQFHSYTQRVGPGLVIYWFGFIEDPVTIDFEYWRQCGILILSDLPDTVVSRPDIPFKLPPSYTDDFPTVAATDPLVPSVDA